MIAKYGGGNPANDAAAAIGRSTAQVAPAAGAAPAAAPAAQAAPAAAPGPLPVMAPAKVTPKAADP